jgi:hypothetical protein
MSGVAGPLTENAPPVVWNPEIVSAQARLFVTTTVLVELVPTVTWPNEMLAGLATIGSLVTPVPAN